jgi:hypothetical protein
MHGAQEGQRGAARRVRSGEELRRRLAEARDLRLEGERLRLVEGWALEVDRALG